jgi:hypothetical protein
MSGRRVGNTPQWLTTQQYAACRSVGSEHRSRPNQGRGAIGAWDGGGADLLASRWISAPANFGSGTVRLENPRSNGGLEEGKQRLACDLSATRAEPCRPLISISYSYDWSERGDLNSRPPVPQTGALTRLRYAPAVDPGALTGRARTVS